MGKQWADATSEQMRDARNWAADCQWADDSEDLKGLSDDQIGRGVQKHYDGGWAGFIEDGDYSK